MSVVIDIGDDEVEVVQTPLWRAPICSECAHCDRHYLNNYEYELRCAATATAHPVTGSTIYHHKCRDKNCLGKCKDFTPKDTEAGGCGCGCLISRQVIGAAIEAFERDDVVHIPIAEDVRTAEEPTRKDMLIQRVAELFPPETTDMSQLDAADFKDKADEIWDLVEAARWCLSE